MSISSVGASAMGYTAAIRPRPEAGELERAGRDVSNDGDADDAAAAVKARAPSVNLNGQAVGTTISTTA